MAQKGNGKRRQAPAYSADAMAVRYMAGVALIALGALIFMAVELRLQGNIFEGLRRICFGLCGAAAYVLPVLPAWAGVLVIWSTQRRAPVKPWLFSLLAFFGLCAFLMTISGALEWQRRQNVVNWGAVINAVYADSTGRMELAGGGGAVGAILGWLTWRYLGTVLGAAIWFILTAFCLLLAMNLTPSRLHAVFTGQAGAFRDQQQRERERMEQQQMQWQRQQLEWQRQQQQIMQQQYPQQPYPQPYTPEQGMPQQPQYPSQQDSGRGDSVRDWQDQMTTRQAVPGEAGHQSSIFDSKPAKPVQGEKGFVSRLFSRGKKEEYDGLSDGSTLPENRSQLPTTNGEDSGRTGGTQPGRRQRTATGAEITPPLTHWQQARPETRAQDPDHPSDISGDSPASPGKTNGLPETADGKAGRTAGQKPTRDETAYRRPAVEEKKPEPKVQPVKPVPAVQQEIGADAFKPKLSIPRKVQDEDEGDVPWAPTPYNHPPLTDLARPQKVLEDTAAEDAARSRKLEETLASFRVPARVVHVTHGPAISRFELELEAGTKVNKVAELEKDIAYGMSATSVRIEAPIPGKRLVGVEVPNLNVTKVTLREVMESDQMQNAKSILTVALGKDIAGTPIVCDLAKMPHLLIAGQTGSGKSVCINAIINSLLYRAGPDEVRMILVDPKVVELQCYNGIPHLLIPVVNDPRKAAAALAWAVAEMQERYDKFAEKKVRNLEGYNQQAEESGEKPMARIVIIIDELADLMMVCKKDVEEYICRLTQLARAAGIHLIVATQRPSVDVITGLIKANIPSRIAFKTASSIDSRTILDRNGSEQLLGWGDMLYAPTGCFVPTRVQGCFLSDDEVNLIAKHVKEANPSTYDPDILERLDQLANGGPEGSADVIINSSDMSGGDGGLFEQAVEFAIQDGQISTSTLQRRLKIGYARAGRLTDEMEERGIVAAKDGSKPRKCLITREEWEEMKKTAEGK